MKIFYVEDIVPCILLACRTEKKKRWVSFQRQSLSGVAELLVLVNKSVTATFVTKFVIPNKQNITSFNISETGLEEGG